MSSDKDAIEHIIKLYGYVIDDKEWDRLGEVFAENGAFIVEGADIDCQGLPAIDSFMRTMVHPLAHYSTNIDIDVAEGADSARARVKIWAPRADGTALIGTYHDELVRTPSGWRFTRRYVAVAERRWRAAA